MESYIVLFESSVDTQWHTSIGKPCIANVDCTYGCSLSSACALLQQDYFLSLHYCHLQSSREATFQAAEPAQALGKEVSPHEFYIVTSCYEVGDDLCLAPRSVRV